MEWLSYIFFWTYIGLVLLAGAWGAFLFPKLDFQLLLGLDLQEIPESSRNSILSQYRFLRALELGFGLFAVVYRKEIFKKTSMNVLFLIIMGSGILARTISWVADGLPGKIHLFFMFYELIGLLVIAFYTRTKATSNG